MEKRSNFFMFGIAISIIFLFLGFRWVLPRFFPPDNIYRSPTASAAGHTIKINDHYAVVTTSATSSYLWFIEENENPVILIENVKRLNYDDESIIVQSVKKNSDNLFFKNYDYCIVNKITKESDCFSTKNEFLSECKKRDITIKLKIKEKFNWY